MYKLIATDMDGTLLNSEHKIHKNNLDSIKKAMENGVKIVMCSGRSFMSIHQYEKELNLIHEENYGIGLNGSMIYNTLSREPLNELKLEKDLAMEIIKELQTMDSDIIVYCDNEIIATKGAEELRVYENVDGVTIKIMEDLSQINKDVSKILVYGPRPELVKLEEHMIKFVDGRCSSFFTGPNFFEFTNIGANKGEALARLAKHLGIDMKDVIAVGDNYNDISMVKAAGVGVAVSNAEQALKDVANYITKTSNEEGALCEVIEKYIFNVAD